MTDGMQPYFRDAVRGDLTAIATILRGAPRCDERGPAPTFDEIRDALAGIDRVDGNYVLVAEYDHQIGAVLQLVTYRRLHPPGTSARIEALEVAEPFRTTGIATMLLEHATARARDLGCRRMHVSTSTARTESHAFWERAGFIHLDRGYAYSLE